MILNNAEKPTDKDISASNWNELLSLLLSLTYQKPNITFTEGANDGGAKDLCFSEHFIESQITNISVFDDANQEYIIGHPKQSATLPDKPSRVLAHIDHMDFEYLPSSEEGKEKIQITGQQYNFYSSDEIESHFAAREKMKSALNLAYAAKAMGWKEIDFGNTTDPIDRRFLIIACEHVGLDYGEETQSKSVVSGVSTVKRELGKSAEIMRMKKAIEAHNKQSGKTSNANPVTMSAYQAFIDFCESASAPIPSKPRQEKKSTPPPSMPNTSAAAASLGL